MARGIEFNSDDYRRQVLAVVHRRGGAEESDPFEIYDVPVEGAGELDDEAVAAQVEAVWAFWQRDRDHPRYRGTILGLLEWHPELSPALLERSSRIELAERVQVARAAREDERFADVDAAIARLVERFGGLPEDKLAGLRALAAGRGIDEAGFVARVRRWRVLPAGAPERTARAAVAPNVLRQLKVDLDELGRVTGTRPPASLFDLLDVPPGSPRSKIQAVRDEMAARNRQRRPDRRRALVDDLLATVTRLLVEGDPEAYLDAVAAQVTAALRPRVAGAVLVEDRLLPGPEREFVAAAQADGLDPARARAVVAALAREFEAPGAGSSGSSGPSGPEASGSASASRRDGPSPSPVPAVVGPADDWRAALSRARAALRAGQVDEASEQVAAALAAAGEMLPPIRAVGDEVDRTRAAQARPVAEPTPTPQRPRPVPVPVPQPVPQPGSQPAPQPGPQPAPAPPPEPSPQPNVADDLGAAHDLHLRDGRLRWTWPYGCTEMFVAWSGDGPPKRPDAAAVTSRKVTNTRYDIDGGVALPAERPLHVAVFACARDGSRLVVATTPTHRHLQP